MTFWDRALRRPQSLWLRKALFQIHLWTGIALGIYVVLISISGSAIVFRNELYKCAVARPKIVAISGPRLSRDALKKAVHQAWPKYSVTYIWESKRKDEATEVWIERNGKTQSRTKGRLVDPFTGQRSWPVAARFHRPTGVVLGSSHQSAGRADGQEGQRHSGDFRRDHPASPDS